MEKDEKLIVGVDLCEDYIQLSYFDKVQLKPISVCKEGEENEYLIPTRLAFQEEKKEWLIGEEVIEGLSREEDIVEVSGLFSKLIEGEEIPVGEESFTAGYLMQMLFTKAFSILNSCYPYKEIAFVGITLEKISPSTVKVMKEAMTGLSLKGRYALLDHDEAFLYHTIHQKQELFVNDTAIFELNEEGTSFRVLQIDQKVSPVVAKISEKYVSENLTRSMMEEDEEGAVQLFENLSMMALEGRFISTVYAVGRGFVGTWADGVLRKLSAGKYVFRGQNLFVQGACYLAREKEEKKEENLIFLGVDRIAAGISILATSAGRETEIVLASPALKWYEADFTRDLIVKGEDELSIQMKDFVSKKIIRRFLSLSGINLTGNELSRIRLKIQFKDKETCIIKATDLGFGSFVPTTNRVWELIWEK